MPRSQGDIPRLPEPMRIVAKDVNDMTTTSSVEYRGKLYSHVDALDMMRLDHQNEVTKVNWQEGMRALGMILTTGRTVPDRT